LTDWDLTALSAQIGFIVPSKKSVAVKKMKLMRKFNVMRWKYAKRNHYNE